MSHEIEAKFKVDSLGPVRRALRSVGAEYLHTMLQSDTYYDTSGRKLLSRDCGLRIRRVRCLRRGARMIDTRPLITAKGPAKFVRAVKVRRETELRLDDPDAVEGILREFGLRETLTIQKRRASYALGKCFVELDELPLIGCFVEIEVPEIEDIARVRDQLKLTGLEVADHYVNLMLAAAGKAGHKRRTFTFERYSKI